MDDEDALLRAEAACRRLTIQYGRGIDTYDDELVLSVFTEDAVWAATGRQPLRGHEQIKAWLAGRDRSILYQHVIAGSMLETLDRNEASGRCSFTGYSAPGAAASGIATARLPETVGIYHDR